MRRLVISPLLFAAVSLLCVLAPGSVSAAPRGSLRVATLAQTSSAPVAQFSVSVVGASDPTQNARVHAPVAFDASASQGTGLSYAWNFGDNSTPASGAKVTHAFATVDDFMVTLTVTDATGQTATSSQTVRVVPYIDSLVGEPVISQVVPGEEVPIHLNIQAPGPATITASLSGDLMTSDPVDFSTIDQLEYVVLKGDVANEKNATIEKQIIEKPGGSIPLQSNVGVNVTYKTSAGTKVDLSFLGSLQKDTDPSKGYWSITYPDFSSIVGPTDPSQPDVENYYLKGDPGFHHPDDPLVRRYAIEAARGDGLFPTDPAQVMDNIYTFVGGLFGSNDPARLEPDTVVAQKIADGTLVPGQRDEQYICISQTYFLSSLSRTLGLPSRELTIALANPISQDSQGAWTVSYVQEGATQVWFAGAWHLYDTWLRIRKLSDYLIRKYAYQAWYTYSPQNYELRAKNGDGLGLYGHNFAIGEDQGVPADPSQWNLLDRETQSGITISGWPGSGSGPAAGSGS